MRHGLLPRLVLILPFLGLAMSVAHPALAAPHVVRPSAATPAWTTFHGDNARTGVDSADSPFASVVKAWDTPALDGKLYAEPLLLGGTVFAATENNTVYAIDAAGGTVAW